MTTTSQEQAEQRDHERRMMVDAAYAFQYTESSVFSGIDELSEFIDANEMMPKIMVDLLLALKKVEHANNHLIPVPSVANNEEEVRLYNRRNESIKRSRNAVIQSVFAIKRAFDAQITRNLEQGK